MKWESERPTGGQTGRRMGGTGTAGGGETRETPCPQTIEDWGKLEGRTGDRRQKTEDRSREQGATKAEDTAKPRKGGHNMVALWQQYKTRFWRKKRENAK